MLSLDLRQRGEARQERIAEWEKIAQESSSPSWDEQYQNFELLVRHEFLGEPRSAGELRFFPKLRPLRDALLAYEAYKHENDSSWSFFSSLLPRIFRAACSCDEASADAHALSPSQVASYVSNAFLLNVRGPLDFMSSGKDPLFVSGAKIAPQKVLCLLAYLDEALHGGLDEASDERTISFERVSGPDWEQAAAPAVQQPLHETVELAAEGEPRPDEAAAGAEAVVCDSVLLFCSPSFGGGAVEGLSATQEEIGLLRYPEALLGLLCFPTPLLPREALLVRSVRRYCDTRDRTPSNPTPAPATWALACSPMAPCPWPHAPEAAPPRVSQARLRAHLRLRRPAELEASGAHDPAWTRRGALPWTRTVRTGARGARADQGACWLRRARPQRRSQLPDRTVGMRGCAHEPWGRRLPPDGHHALVTPRPVRTPPERPSLTRRRQPHPPLRAGFSGGQPVLRMLLQLLAAARAGVRLRLELPSDTAPKWFAGVLAELRAHPPTAAALHALLCDELPQQRPRLAQDVPAYCSFLIKASRKAASASATTSAAASAAATSAAATSAAAAAAATPTDEGPDATVPLKRVRTQSLCPDDAVPCRQRQGEKGREV